MKTKILVTIALFFGILNPILACEVCQSQQPKILKGITHGAGPVNSWDYVITIIAAAIVLFTLVLSIKYLVKPGEKNPDHIKNIVVNQNSEI